MYSTLAAAGGRYRRLRWPGRRGQPGRQNWHVVDAVVFDFDGVILDTEPPCYQAWAEVYERHGQHLSLDFWTTIIGRGVNTFDAIGELEQRLGRALDREAIVAARRAREAELVSALEMLPGVLAWRDEAQAMGARLGVASSSTRRWVVGHLERLGLDGWQCISCGDDVLRAKPAPDLYLAVLECLGVRASEAVAVEDSAAGVQAAKEAGLYVVAVPSELTAGHDLSQADVVLRSLAETTFGVIAAGIHRGRA